MLENLKISYEFNRLAHLIEELIRNDKDKLRTIDSGRFFGQGLKKNIVLLIKLSKELEKNELKVDSKIKKNLSELVKDGRLSPEFIGFIKKLDSIMQAQEFSDNAQISDLNQEGLDKIAKRIRQDLEELKREKIEIKIINDERVKAMQRAGKLIEMVDINGVRYILKANLVCQSKAEKKKIADEMRKEVAASMIGSNLVNIAKYHILKIDDISGPLKERLSELKVKDFVISEFIDDDFKARLGKDGQTETLFVFYNLIGDFDKMFDAHLYGSQLSESFAKFFRILSKEQGKDIPPLPTHKLKRVEDKFRGLEHGLNNIIRTNGQLVSFDHGDFGTRWEKSNRDLWVGTNFSELERKDQLKIPHIVKAVHEFQKVDIQKILVQAGFSGKDLTELIEVLFYNQKYLPQLLVDRFNQFYKKEFAEALSVHFKKEGLLQ